MLLPFLRQEVDMLFQQDNAFPHTATAEQCSLHAVQVPWTARSTDVSPIEHVWDMMKWGLTLSPEPAATIAELRQHVEDAWNKLEQNGIRHFYDYLHVRTHTCIAIRGGNVDIVVGLEKTFDTPLELLEI